MGPPMDFITSENNLLCLVAGAVGAALLTLAWKQQRGAGARLNDENLVDLEVLPIEKGVMLMEQPSITCVTFFRGDPIQATEHIRERKRKIVQNVRVDVPVTVPVPVAVPVPYTVSYNVPVPVRVDVPRPY